MDGQGTAARRGEEHRECESGKTLNNERMLSPKHWRDEGNSHGQDNLRKGLCRKVINGRSKARLRKLFFMKIEEIFKKIDGAEMRYKIALGKLEGNANPAAIENIINELTKAHEEIVAALRMYTESIHE